MWCLFLSMLKYRRQVLYDLWLRWQTVVTIVRHHSQTLHARTEGGHGSLMMSAARAAILGGLCGINYSTNYGR